MAEVFQKSGRHCVEGSEVLRWRISLPPCDGRMAEFYREIGARVVGYCEGALSELAAREFEASDDSEKRFSFAAFFYRLEGRVSYEDDALLSVFFCAELRRRGERIPLGHFESGQVWEKESELLLAPEEVVRLRCNTPLSRRERKAARGVFLSEEGVFWQAGNVWRKKPFF